MHKCVCVCEPLGARNVDNLRSNFSCLFVAHRPLCRTPIRFSLDKIMSAFGVVPSVYQTLEHFHKRHTISDERTHTVCRADRKKKEFRCKSSRRDDPPHIYIYYNNLYIGNIFISFRHIHHQTKRTRYIQRNCSCIDDEPCKTNLFR